MDRGQPGRPADGSDEAIEAIDAVGAPADGDVSDRPIEAGPSNEARPEAAPDTNPPAHWLAYIRARAPWLLAPGGSLAEATGAGTPDVVPNGPSAHVAPWPPTATTSAADLEAAPAPTFDAGAMTARAGARGDAPGDDAPGDAPHSGRAERADGPTAVPPSPATVDADGPLGNDPFATEDPRGSRAGTADDPTDPRRGDAGDRVGGVQRPIDPFEPEAARGASPGDDPAAAPVVERGADETATAVPMPSVPLPDVSREPRPVTPWPTFATEPTGGARRDAELPPPAAGRTLPGVSPGPGPAFADPPTAGRTPPAVPTVPEPAFGHPPTTAPPGRPDGWQVQATPPDTSTVARLALPAWPALPETLPEDDPDWRSIERRLQRAARLDHEQRRR